MLFISPADFFEKVKALKRLSRAEERDCAEKMKEGDPAAREKLIEAYLPMVSACIRHLNVQYQTLELVFLCCSALEKAVDHFDFLQEGESFSHRLSWCMRQTITAHIADKRSI